MKPPKWSIVCFICALSIKNTGEHIHNTEDYHPFLKLLFALAFRCHVHGHNTIFRRIYWPVCSKHLTRSLLFAFPHL